MRHTLSSIPQLADGLRRGLTLLYPTDTIWGLGCSAVDEAAVDRLYALKRRDPAKSMLVLLPDTTPLLGRADLAPLLLAARPTTVIVPAGLVSGECCSPLQAADGTIGVRIPRHPFCQTLIKALGAPLVSTSANLSGHPSPASFEDISAALLDQVDMIADPSFEEPASGGSSPAQPSRIVKLTDQGLVTIRP